MFIYYCKRRDIVLCFRFIHCKYQFECISIFAGFHNTERIGRSISTRQAYTRVGNQCDAICKCPIHKCVFDRFYSKKNPNNFYIFLHFFHRTSGMSVMSKRHTRQARTKPQPFSGQAKTSLLPISPSDSFATLSQSKTMRTAVLFPSWAPGWDSSGKRGKKRWKHCKKHIRKTGQNMIAKSAGQPEIQVTPYTFTLETDNDELKNIY